MISHYLAETFLFVGVVYMMALCETCGNEYDKAFTVVVADVSHTFDSFERLSGNLFTLSQRDQAASLR